jgi:arylformamidase
LIKPIFLSHIINENTPAYGGAKNAVEISYIKSRAKGDNSNDSTLRLPAHIGTHIDFPRHFDDAGKPLNDYEAAFWRFSKVGFVSCPVDAFSEALDTIPADIELLIWKSGFGGKRETEAYWKEQPVIPSEFAWLLRKKFPGLRVFGFDMISLTSQLDKAEGKKAHTSFLLETNILVIEDMKLDALNEAPEEVVVCPLLIDGADGSPCTIIAF